MRKNKSLQQALIIYWLLLLYVLAALIWWFITLEKQNTQVYKSDVNILLSTSQSNTNLSSLQHIEQLKKLKQRRTAKHIGEGITFLLVIGIGAFSLYKLVKKQWSLTKQQQNFIMAVTHELKTPIAITKLNIETIQKRKLEPPIEEKLLKNSLDEINRLNDLVSNILFVSQLESNEFKMQKDEIQLSYLVYQLLNDYQKTDLTQTFETYITPNITLIGDEFMLKMAINNLINNAIKYSPNDSKIIIILNQEPAKIVLQIKDEGIGINAEERKHLFQKFYRSKNEITRSQKGTGLGLFLSKKIIDYHSGSITYSNNAPKESIFTISLPAYAKQ